MDDVQRGAFTAADAGKAAETLTRLIGRAQVQAPDVGHFALKLSWTVAGPVMSRRAQVGSDSTVHMGVESPQTINIAQVTAGRMSVRAGGDHARLDATPYLMPRHRFTSTMAATDLTILALDRTWVEECARELLQQEDFRLDFTGTTPHQEATAQYWAGTTRYLQQVLGSDEVINIPFVRAEVVRRVATALLWCFPSTFSDQTVPDETTVRLPGPVRRAVAYIDAHLDQPFDLAQVAAAARLPAHRLVIAFRQHLGTTPGGYVRTARLDAAHHDLLAADPVRGDTVGVIAHRWGFVDLARFTLDYRAQYGCTPTHTLRS